MRDTPTLIPLTGRNEPLNVFYDRVLDALIYVYLLQIPSMFLPSKLEAGTAVVTLRDGNHALTFGRRVLLGGIVNKTLKYICVDHRKSAVTPSKGSVTAKPQAFTPWIVLA